MKADQELGKSGCFSSLRMLNSSGTLAAFVAVVLGLFASTVMFGQGGSGGINGTVLDTSGAAVGGSTVVALDTKKGTTLKTVTTGAGFYSFVSVAPGSYQVTVTHDGFETDVEKNITVTTDQAQTVNVKLKVGATNETVTVDASTSILDNTSSTVGQLIGAATIDRVPLLTRDVYELIQLSAGVSPANGTPNSSGTPAIFNARSLIDVSSYTINGSLQGSVYYMLDGSPIGIAENNISAIIPAFQVPEDGVEEFRVETQNTPATYSSGGAGVISLTTKSGTNKFHGDGFGYFRPNAVAANDYFFKQNNPGLPPPDFHRYQEGGAIGGPIKKDKLFFFADYEATQQDQLETGALTVPTDAEKTGDFSADSFTVYNPYAPDNADGTRQPFEGNKIPVSLQDPVAANFVKMFPEPNNAGEGTFHTNNRTVSGLDPNNGQKFDVRIDYAMNEKNRIFGRFSFGRLDFGNADLYGSSNPYDPFYYVNVTNTRNVLVADDYTLSPTAVLQLRYSFTRHYEDQTGDPRQNGFDITTFGFPQALADQVIYKQFPVAYLSTTSSVGGTGNDDAFLFASENSDATATLNKVLGKHEISAGFEYQKKFMNVGQPNSPAGAYSFDNTPTSSTAFANDSSDFAALMLGMGSCPGCEGGNFTKDIFGALSNPYYAAFIQDSYHITPKLTFNLGLRWDIFGGRTERHNRQEYFDPTIASTVNGINLTGGERFVGNGGSAFTTNMKNFGPRAAFTWQPRPDFVLRGGAGIYYGPSTSMVANASVNGDGFSSSTNWNATSYNADGNTVMLNPLSNPFPNGVVQPTGTSLGAATNIGVGLATVLHSSRTTATYNFNLGFEVQLPGQSLLSVAYVGSRGLFLPLGAVDLNQLSLQEIQQYGSALCVDQGTAGCQMAPNTLASLWPATSPWYGASTVPLWLSLEPYQQFNGGGFGGGVGINGYPGADSEYSSLQTKFEKKLSHHVTTLATFTWGKLITDDSQPPLGFVGLHAGAPQDWRNLNLEHSVSAQDVKLQFNWNVSYDLPIGKGRALNLNGKMNTALGGWTINGIAYFSDGVPIAAPVGTGSVYFNQRVDMNCNPAAGAAHTAAQWFNYTCFSQPKSPLIAGTAPTYISSVRSDGAHQVDVSLYKNFALRGEQNVRIEIGAFNVSNTVQYGYPNVFWNQDEVNDPTVMAGFGQIFGAANLPRQFQFGAKYTF
jgi:hypothetical protein